MTDCISQSRLQKDALTDLGWCIYQLELWICVIVLYCRRTDTTVFAKLDNHSLSNEPPSLSSPPPPSNVSEMNKLPLGGLNRRFTVYKNYHSKASSIHFLLWHFYDLSDSFKALKCWTRKEKKIDTDQGPKQILVNPGNHNFFPEMIHAPLREKLARAPEKMREIISIRQWEKAWSFIKFSPLISRACFSRARL